MGKGDHLARTECSQQLHLSSCMALLLCRIVVNIFVHVPQENPKLQGDLVGLRGRRIYDSPEIRGCHYLTCLFRNFSSIGIGRGDSDSCEFAVPTSFFYFYLLCFSYVVVEDVNSFVLLDYVS